VTAVRCSIAGGQIAARRKRGVCDRQTLRRTWRSGCEKRVVQTAYMSCNAFRRPTVPGMNLAPSCVPAFFTISTGAAIVISNHLPAAVSVERTNLPQPGDATVAAVPRCMSRRSAWRLPVNVRRTAGVVAATLFWAAVGNPMTATVRRTAAVIATLLGLAGAAALPLAAAAPAPGAECSVPGQNSPDGTLTCDGMRSVWLHVGAPVMRPGQPCTRPGDVTAASHEGTVTCR
jgi:hypothetical protein